VLVHVLWLPILLALGLGNSCLCRSFSAPRVNDIQGNNQQDTLCDC